jgi:hypothetical protein
VIFGSLAVDPVAKCEGGGQKGACYCGCGGWPEWVVIIRPKVAGNDGSSV